MKLKSIIGIVGVLLMSVGCKQEGYAPYADQLKDERKQIAAFMERQGLVTLKEFPADSVFAANEYYFNEKSGLYFQLVDKGDVTGDTIQYRDDVIIRYDKYDLTEYPDTIFNRNTNDSPYPSQFKYLVDYASNCQAWHEAAGYMRYSGSKAKLIVPGKIGFSADFYPLLIPYGYDIHSIQFR